MPSGIVATIASAFTSVGVGATTAGILADATLGAGLGAGVSGITGGDIGLGALTGGITGGALGFAPSVAGELGISNTAADILTGAAGGALGAGITGSNPLTGALYGGAAGGLTAALGPAPTSGQVTSPSGAAPAAGGASVGAGAASSAVEGAGIADLTSPQLAGTAGLTAPGEIGAGAGAAGALTVSSPGLTASPLSGPIAGGNAFTGALTSPELSTSAGGNNGIVTSGGPLSNSFVSPGALSTPADQTGLANPPATSSVGQFAEHPSLKNAGNILTSNPGSVISALGLGYEALTQPKLPSQSGITNTLNTQAGQLASQGATLQNYINTGTLPPGAMEAVNSATQSAKAALRSRYAAMGLTGSTSEATALAGVDQQAAGQIFQIADSLLQTGIKESGLSADIYKAILSETDAQSKIMSDAISNFASSIAGGGNHGLTLNLGQAA